MENQIPSHIQIETVAGYCNIKCVMCPIEKSIRKEIMTDDFFESIVKRLLPIKDEIKIFTILGLGETLIDPSISTKIKIAKNYGFKEVGIFSNGMALNKNVTLDLLNAGIDVFIFSIDGFTNETQESIRTGSSLDKIIKNIDNLIEQRSTSNAKIMIRFTSQEKNIEEWNDFKNFWSSKLRKGDIITKYNIHNVGHIVENEVDKTIKNLKCREVYNRMIVFSDGKIGLCCADQFGHYNIGNILETDPIELYNHELFKHYRKEMDNGNIANLELCKDCTVAYSTLNAEHVIL